MKFNVFEGDFPEAKDNHKLGEFILDNIKPAPNGEMQFDVAF